MAITAKQKVALELLTSGLGLEYKEIAARAGVTPKSLWSWRNDPSFSEFQEELKKLNEARWQAAEDAARAGAIKLCQEGNQKMIQFVLQNVGYNPSTKVEGNLSTDMNITISIED